MPDYPIKTDSDMRQVSLNYVVRGGIVTATVSLTTGTAASLIAGDADYPLDLVEAMFSNNSTVTATVALVDDGTSVRTFQVPASSSFEFIPPVPIPQSKTAGAWRADMNDITGTTVVVDAIFIKGMP